MNKSNIADVIANFAIRRITSYLLSTSPKTAKRPTKPHKPKLNLALNEPVSQKFPLHPCRLPPAQFFSPPCCLLCAADLFALVRWWIFVGACFFVVDELLLRFQRPQGRLYCCCCRCWPFVTISSYLLSHHCIISSDSFCYLRSHSQYNTTKIHIE